MHIPVMLKEVIEHLDLHENQNAVDCTLGGGGHTKELLRHNGPAGKILGIDWDIDTLQETTRNIRTSLSKKDNSRFVGVHGNFSSIENIAKELEFKPVHGILLDLGFSSDQLERRKRGFSFLKNEPLDMRYDTQNPITAAKIVNYSSKQEIENILQKYGEEAHAKNIAEAISQTRTEQPIEKTAQLVEIISKAVPRAYTKRKIHPATKTFQALRIATNTEFENLLEALRGATNILKPGGKIVIISFHSLEDKIVKDFFRQNDLLDVVTKKPISPSQEEVKANPRSRSAKLRAATKINV